MFYNIIFLFPTAIRKNILYILVLLHSSELSSEVISNHGGGGTPYYSRVPAKKE